MSKTQKGLQRYLPLRDKLVQQLVDANNDARIRSVGNRMRVVAQAIRKMNHKNGVFLELPAIVPAYSIDTLKQQQLKLRNSNKGI